MPGLVDVADVHDNIPECRPLSECSVVLSVLCRTRKFKKQNVPRPPRLCAQLVKLVSLEPRVTFAMVSFPSFCRFRNRLPPWACSNGCSCFYVSSMRTHAENVANTGRRVRMERQNNRARRLNMHRVLSGVNVCTTCHAFVVLLHVSRPTLLYQKGWEYYNCKNRGF